MKDQFFFFSALLLEVSVLQKMAKEYSFDCFLLNDESSVDGINEITLSWGDIGGEILILVPSDKKDAFGQLSNFGWIIVAFGEFYPYPFVNSMY